MIKLFISDLDGTLLNKWHLADGTINQAIAELELRGYLFAVATGRHLRKYQRFSLSFLKNTDYIIAMNGALVIDKNRKVISEIPIASQMVLDLFQNFPEISFECITSDEIFVKESRFNHFVKGFKGQVTFKNIARATLNLLIGSFNYSVNDAKILEKSLLKIECITNNLESKARLIEYLDSHRNEFSYAFNDEVHFEITGVGVNKSAGVLQLLKYLNLHPDQVAVYGNDTNDVEMLKYFVHSYAPSSAKEPAKQAANTIIGHAYEHAVINHILETIHIQDAY